MPQTFGRQYHISLRLVHAAVAGAQGDARLDVGAFVFAFVRLAMLVLQLAELGAEDARGEVAARVARTREHELAHRGGTREQHISR